MEHPGFISRLDRRVGGRAGLWRRVALRPHSGLFLHTTVCIRLPALPPSMSALAPVRLCTSCLLTLPTFVMKLNSCSNAVCVCQSRLRMTLEAAVGNPSAVLPSASLWPSCFTSLVMTLLQQCYEVLFHSGALDHRTKVD